MYNSITEQTIREIPVIGDINVERLPQELTRIFARIVSLRRRIAEGAVDNFPKKLKTEVQLLRTLAGNLETLTVLDRSHEHHRSIAFVAGTAHYLLLMLRYRNTNDFWDNILSDQEVPATISTIVLFLIGNSPADAAEVASKVPTSKVDHEIRTLIVKAICHLAKGELRQILSLNIPDQSSLQVSPNIEAELYLWELILMGIKQLAGTLLGETSETKINGSYFQEVIRLSVYQTENDETELVSIYAGPYHLARLLNVLSDDLLSRGIIHIPPPTGVDNEAWYQFMKQLATQRPYLWENHFDAVSTGFLNPGISSVLTFPTGAGKTTLSELKIAAAVLNGKSVIYLVPTHALEDQINRSLDETFKGMIGDREMELGAEFTEFETGDLPKISVMTPERCLTKLSIEPETFQDVNLIVFDEFHLINGKDDRIERRSIDAMFCLLRLFIELPEADFMLISAMVENGAEISDWLASVTRRPSVLFNSSWKPTRQLHGCILFKEDEINELKKTIRTAFRNRNTKGPPAALKRALKASAYNIFSLKNMWESKNFGDYFIKNLLPAKVTLAINNAWQLTSNRNEIAADLAAYFASRGIKTLVFVDNPLITQSTANKITEKLGADQNDRSAMMKNNDRLLNALQTELGDLSYSYFVGNNDVAVHHGLMLPLERRLNEQFFRHKNGVNVVTATATLAQGINLPAEIVIIAGDDRYDEETDQRETVAPHEILNAAGRAGRAGTAAQGVVLIIPGDIVTFQDSTLSDRWWTLKEKVFSKSDQCLPVNDPFTYFLDSLSDDPDELSPEQKNIIFRLNSNKNSGDNIKGLFNRSLAAYRQQLIDDSFDERIQNLIKLKETFATELLYAQWTETVSLKTGIDPELIDKLGNDMETKGLDVFFKFTVSEIVTWLMNWFVNQEQRIAGFFAAKGAQAEIARALNLDKQNFTLREIANGFGLLEPLLQCYISGDNFKAIDDSIPGRVDGHLTKARHFCLKLIPHLSFAFGVFSLIIREKYLEKEYDVSEIPFSIKALATFIREGFDTEAKLAYKISNSRYTRVQCHLIIAQ